MSSTLAITLEGYPIFLRLLAPNITQKHVQHSPPYAEITAYQCIYMQMNESHYAYRTSWIHTIFMRWNLHTESTPSSIIHITHTHTRKRESQLIHIHISQWHQNHSSSCQKKKYVALWCWVSEQKTFRTLLIFLSLHIKLVQHTKCFFSAHTVVVDEGGGNWSSPNGAVTPPTKCNQVPWLCHLVTVQPVLELPDTDHK